MVAIIPVQPVPRQIVTAYLGANLTAQITIYQKFYGLFCDVAQNNIPIIYGVKCENLNRIVRDSYLMFTGDIAFIDQQGLSDPFYTGLGTRYLLYYLEPADLIALSPAASI